MNAKQLLVRAVFTLSLLAVLVTGVLGLSLWSGGTAQAQAGVSIPEIQGAGHLSPFAGQIVTTTGVVTAIGFRSYYVQDPVGDGNPATSDGLFVFESNTADTPRVGDFVQLTDTVTEFIGGGAATGNLSTTQMSNPRIIVLSSNNPPPIPVVIGSSGRIPPNEVVISSDELPVNLQTDPGLFDPENDAIDFYESLEGMLVTVEQPVAVSATRTFSAFSSELFTLVNNGAHIAPTDARTARGGISLQPDPDNLGDQNPERVQIQFDGTIFPFPVPAITVGDLLGDITGVVGYSFGNFEVNAIAPFAVFPAGLEREITELAGNGSNLTLASYNVLDLSATASDDNQRATLASHIAINLGSPDVIALQEIQDNNGSINDGTTDATLTLQALAAAILVAGGPDYTFFDVAPANGTSGGAPGGNIRNAFLYNPSRVGLVEVRSLTPDELLLAGAGDPNAFAGAPNPLVGVFAFGGEQFTVINNQLTSRFGSTPIFGGPQPFVQAGEIEREAQTQALNDYVDFLLADDGGRAIVVLGDMNTFEFTNDLTEILPGTGPDRVLTNLIDSLKDDNVYSFNVDGNSQVLDHFLVSDALLGNAKLDIVHVNVDFPRIDNTVGSDHDPLVARLSFNEPPVAVADSGVTDSADFIVIDVLANDTDADGDELSVTAVTDGANGTVVINVDDTVTYTRNGGFNGTDNFTYTVSDGAAEAMATVSVQITPDLVLGAGVTIGPGTTIAPGAEIGDNVTIGAGGTIGEGAVIGAGSTIGDGVTLGAEAVIKQGASVGDDTIIGDEAKIEKDSVIGSGVTIGAKTVIKKGASVGDDTIIGDEAKIEKDSVIGSGVTIGDKTVIKKGTVIPDGVTL